MSMTIGLYLMLLLALPRKRKRPLKIWKRLKPPNKLQKGTKGMIYK
jgi:hypothetical protein